MSDWNIDMPIRVTKYGTLPEEKLHTGKCGYCATEVEFKASAGTRSHDQRDGDAMYVACPVCRRPIWSRA